MKPFITLLILLPLFALAQQSDSIALNFSTPEDALISFDDCMLRKDLSNALLCKDFTAEAVLFLEQSEIKTTDSSYINDIKQQIQDEFLADFNKYRPNTSGIRARHFPEKQVLSKNLVLLREVIIFKNQVIISQHYYIHQSSDGKWKVLNKE